MKNESIQFNEQGLTLATQSFNYKSQSNASFCSFKNTAFLLCAEKDCNYNAFICQDQTCNCKQQHKDCLNVTIKSVVKKCESKKVSTKSFQTVINNKIDKIIDQLSQFREKIIIKINEQFQLFGLDPNEKKFIKVINNDKQQKNVTGNLIWNIINSQKYPSSMKKVVQVGSQAFKRIICYLQQQVYKMKKRIQTLIKDIMAKQPFFSKSQIRKYQNQNTQQSSIKKLIEFNDSNIITQYLQFKTLQNFFLPKTLKQVKLLYKASKNNFQIKKFHQKCDGISDTLTIVETEFGKKIGGYTPIEWKSLTNGDYVKDESIKSFLFSLTNGDKFVLRDKQKAVYHNKSYGPTFGTKDFYISNQADILQNSFANCNYSYINKKYKLNSIYNWMEIGGNKEDDSFRIKQWQVWGLQFA